MNQNLEKINLKTNSPQINYKEALEPTIIDEHISDFGKSAIETLVKEKNAPGFEITPELNNNLKEIGQLQPGQKLEFILPDNINPYFFVAELGRPARSFEYSGIYDPKTRSVIVSRGANPGQLDLSIQSANLTPRIKRKNGIEVVDDIPFHTHPFTGKKEKGGLSC